MPNLDAIITGTRSSRSRNKLTATPPSTPTPSSGKRKRPEFEPVVGRIEELLSIRNFISHHMSSKTSGSLHVSGTPGTGKTACIEKIYSEHEGLKCKINCFGVADPKTIYSEILWAIEGSRSGELPLTPSRNTRELEKLEKALRDSRKMKLIILDEIDQLQLGNSDNSVLESIFRWPTLEGYYVIVIGISNTLHLTDSFKFGSKIGTPKKLRFQPYSKDQLADILISKVQAINEDEGGLKIHPNAISLCCKRVANQNGDARMAFGVIERGARFAITPTKTGLVEVSENDPLRVMPPAEEFSVKISDIQAVMSEQSSTKTLGALPFQQRILIGCGLKLAKEKKPITVGALVKKYVEIIASGSQEEVLDFCDRLAAQGIFMIKKNKTNCRDTVISFKSDEEAAFSIVGKPLMDSILNGTTRTQSRDIY